MGRALNRVVAQSPLNRYLPRHSPLPKSYRDTPPL
jgi:hypothetical protein